MYQKLFKKLFSKKKKNECALPIEFQYFDKYINEVGREHVLFLLHEYELSVFIFEPIRHKFTAQEQQRLYEAIDQSKLLLPLEKIEAIVGFMMVLDGALPLERIVHNLGKVFGKEFIETIQNKEKVFEKEIMFGHLKSIIQGRVKLTDDMKEYVKRKVSALEERKP